MENIRIEISEKAANHFRKLSLAQGYKGKLKPYLEAKLEAEAKGEKKTPNKQQKLKL